MDRVLFDYGNSNSFGLEQIRKTQDLCFEFNNTRPSDTERRNELLRMIFGVLPEGIQVQAPLQVDFGVNVRIGKNFFANYNLVLIDGAKITFGDDVLVGPNCGFHCNQHPIVPEQRTQFEYADPITVGDRVWFGAGVTVLSGVTIGSGSIIGAGSVVTKDIPENVIAAGTPCRVIRKITVEDKMDLERMRSEFRAGLHKGGLPQRAYFDFVNPPSDVIAQMQKAADLCFEFNHTKPSDTEKKSKLLSELFRRDPEGLNIIAPIHVDIGENVRIGKNFFSNYNLTIIDGALVTFGDNVLIGPDCGFYCNVHLTHPDQRPEFAYADPIVIGDDVWIGAGVTVLSGVTIGSGSVIGAGSVVTKDIPDNVIAYGSPCRAVRKITDADTMDLERMRSEIKA